MCDNTSVQVAVRVRPLITSETERGCQDILEVHNNINQIRIKSTDKAFTYNHVFGSNTTQDHFYCTCIKSMIDNLFKGYNVTILAYGQTGSGKTHSMGTAYKGNEEMAVIPRAIHDIFAFVKDNFSYDFTMSVSFMELYQEVLYDLLSTKARDQCVVEIREDNAKGIIIPGLTEQPVNSATEALDFLMKGSAGRATGCTNMNAQSSRSHAIFTVSICMQKKDNSNENKTAKFHLVDLAGSERSKKTGATGQTFKEGVNINKGLLALGNVISALGDEKMANTYICYRDSNLTRLLKDSLGGNSITLMIACVSPADYNVEETLSTLRYADRARKIKNKPVVNQDAKSAEINRLNKLVQQLRLELVGQGGPIICQAELELLKKENGELKLKVCQLNIKLSTTLTDKTMLFERVLLMESANEELTNKLKEVKEEYNLTLSHLNLSIERSDVAAIKENVIKLQSIQNCLTDINSVHVKNNDEMRRHEASSVRNSSPDEANSEYEINERQESHTDVQFALNSELQEVMKKLAVKEHLVEQIVANTCRMVDYTCLAENEAKIALLQNEKEELLQELKNLQVQGVGNKVAEQRRKRVQELENQIHDLRKKICEQDRLIKLKEKDEQKIKQLNNEIVSMKHMKVQLIKKMREESERFRSWKQQKERDLLKLKDQDRKRQNQIAKMTTMHSKQQNVWKRKVEEAAAVNKRLKDALAKRVAVQEAKKTTGKVERIAQWLQHELEVHVNTVDAEVTLKSLCEDRAVLYQQLNSLKESEEMCDSIEMKQLEDDIQLRTTQIQDLQHKIIDSHEEGKEQTRFDNVQTMAEAKHALKVLFELVTGIRKSSFSNENKIQELECVNLKLTNEIKNLNRENREKEQEYIKTEMEYQREYEEKISMLLHRLNDKKGEGESDKLYEIIQNSVLKLEEEKEELLTQVGQLTKKIEEINNVAASSKNPSIVVEDVHVGDKKPVGENVHTHINVNALAVHTPLVTDDDLEIDNTVTDPDWRKTPLARKISRLKRETQQSNVRSMHDRLKRSSGGGCACKGSCANRVCGCRKTTQSCDATCKCSTDLCTNRGNSLENESEDTDDSNETFRKPRKPLEEVREDIFAIKQKKARKLTLL